MRRFFRLALISIVPHMLYAQSGDSTMPKAPSAARDNDWHVTLTLFRSPGTGIQVAKGHLAAFVGFYPTVIERDGEQRNTNFVRLGVAAYASTGRTSPYASVSFAPSLTKGWSNSGLVDAGMRHYFTRRFSGQLGAALLYAPGNKETRVNPTIGLGVRF